MSKYVVGGVLAMIAGAVIVGASFSGGAPRAFAGISSPTPTFAPQPTPCGGVPGNAVAASAQQLPTCTPVGGVKSATPTTSPTSVATATPVPATAMSTTKPNTPVPPTATSPAGGAGAAIGAPNTGSGDGTSGGQGMMWELMIGLALAATGAGLVARGVLRRR